MRYLIYLMIFFIGCKVDIDTEKKEDEPTNKETVNSAINLEGYVSPDIKDLYYNMDYKLYDFKVYALGRTSYYETYVSHNGFYVFPHMNPDTYDLILIYETFDGKIYKEDNQGKYTYYDSKTVLVDASKLAPKLIPRKSYTSEKETQDIMHDVLYAKEKVD